MVGKEGGKNEKTTLCKTWLFHAFSWFAHTGLYVTPVGGKEGGKNEKNTLCKTWFFHAFSWFAHTGLYVTPVGCKEGGKNEKTTLCKTWFFRGLPIRASMSPLWGARKEAKTKKTHFVKRGFFVVCPYGPLCHPCEGQGRRQKRKNHTL